MILSVNSVLQQRQCPIHGEKCNVQLTHTCYKQNIYFVVSLIKEFEIRTLRKNDHLQQIQPAAEYLTALVVCVSGDGFTWKYINSCVQIEDTP